MHNEANNEIYYKCLKYIDKNYCKELYIPRLIVGRGYLYDCEIFFNIFDPEFAKAFWGEFKQPVVESLVCVTDIKTDKILLECPWGKFQTTKPYSEDEKLLGAIFMFGKYKDNNFDYKCNGYVCTDKGSIGWEKGLQEMVLHNEPLKYLEQFIKE